MSRYRKIAVYSKEGKRLAASILEVADTPERRRKGLMGREDLPWVCGMLFEGLSGGGYFWMKNCHIGLDVMFLDDNGTVTKVYSMPADGGSKHYGYDDETVAIEVPLGFCRKNGIDKGCEVVIRKIGGGNG